MAKACRHVKHHGFLVPLNFQTRKQLARKQVAAVTASNQSVGNEFATQNLIPNKWKALLRNKLAELLSKAAKKYLHERVRRHQRNILQTTAIEISSDSHNMTILT